ncbi:MAG: D-alanyl-D-alanine carboxypeptidase family protein [Betaproteobacteria bacterium]
MKKVSSLTLSLTLALILGTAPLGAQTPSSSPAGPSPGGAAFDIAAPMGILTEAETGQVLWAKNADRRHPPASITKLMQLLLVMEALDAGRISLADQVTASHRAATFGGSSMWVKEGERFTVEELLKGVAVASANDASVMLAEFMSGSEEAFVERMNRRAAKLGLQNTRFVNSMGLPAPKGQEGNYSTARDIAVMSRELLRHPRVLRYTASRRWEIRDGKNRFENTNHLLGRYEGVDGLKTGHTEEAGWCLVATAQRGGRRLIAVVLDAASDAERVSQAAALLDYGFNRFTRVPLVRQGEKVASFPLPRGGRPVVAVAGRELTVIAPRGTRPLAKVVFTRRRDLGLPLQAGQEVGGIRARLADGTWTASVPAVAKQEVKRVNPVVAALLALGRWLLHVLTLGRR